MSILVNNLEVYATENDLFYDLTCRSTNKASWETFGINQKLLDESLNPIPGVYIDYIDNLCLSQAVFNEDHTSIIVEPIFDTRFHFNIRLSKQYNWDTLFETWMKGKGISKSNNQEISVTLNKVSLIDPTSIKSQFRVWA